MKHHPAGAALKILRVQQNECSASDIARAAGVSPQVIFDVENNGKHPSSRILAAYSVCLGIPTEVIVEFYCKHQSRMILSEIAWLKTTGKVSVKPKVKPGPKPLAPQRP